MNGPAQPPPPAGLLRGILRLPVYLYHARLGALLGHRFLLLVHRGRRSGRRYETVLEVVRYDLAMKESVVVAGWGRRTAWLHNVKAGGAVAVATGGRRYAPAHRLLDADEAFAVMAAYEHRNRFIAPVVRAVLSRLVGWRYDGTAAARGRLVVQLPMLAFRPRSRVRPCHATRRARKRPPSDTRDGSASVVALDDLPNRRGGKRRTRSE